MTTLAYEPDALDAACASFSERGFTIIRGLYPEPELEQLQRALEDLQRRLVAGELPEACGTVILDDPDAIIDGEPFAHYVCEITPVSERARPAVTHPVVVELWLYPDGSRLLEISTKGVPEEAFQLATVFKAFLLDGGFTLKPGTSKTSSALSFFSRKRAA